jgi:hypothetical protein
MAGENQQTASASRDFRISNGPIATLAETERVEFPARPFSSPLPAIRALSLPAGISTGHQFSKRERRPIGKCICALIDRMAAKKPAPQPNR